MYLSVMILQQLAQPLLSVQKRREDKYFRKLLTYRISLHFQISILTLYAKQNLKALLSCYH